MLYCCEGWGKFQYWTPNGHTELTVERPYSGKHVIEVSVVRKATWWRLWKRKAVRICTLVESSLKIERVNRSMTDVATIHFNQIGVRSTEFTLVEKPTVDDRLSKWGTKKQCFVEARNKKMLNATMVKTVNTLHLKCNIPKGISQFKSEWWYNVYFEK